MNKIIGILKENRFSILSVLLMSGIFFLSGFKISNQAQKIWMFDKVVHFNIFGVLSIFLIKAIQERKPEYSLKKSIVIAVIISTFFGLTDEIHQYYVPYRNCDVYDLLADFLGSLFFSYAFWLTSKILRFKNNKNH
jgi:VanZ family protein